MTPEDILNAEFPGQVLDDIHRDIGRLPHATHALWALSYWLLDRGDQRGAKIVADYAGEFAKHEAGYINQQLRGSRQWETIATPTQYVPRQPEPLTSMEYGLIREAQELAPPRTRVLLTDLRERVGGSRAQQDAALLSLQDKGMAVLYRDDALAMKRSAERARIESGSLSVGGFPRHFLLLS